MSKLVYGIWPALVTPFGDNLELKIDAVTPLMHSLLETDISGFFVSGGTSEGRAMTVPERKAIGEAAVRAVGGQVPVILHVGERRQKNPWRLRHMLPWSEQTQWPRWRPLTGRMTWPPL